MGKEEKSIKSELLQAFHSHNVATGSDKGGQMEEETGLHSVVQTDCLHHHSFY